MTGRDIIARYLSLLQEVDSWFVKAAAQYPARIRCTEGCSECCRSLFDITLLDAALLREGFDRLPQGVRTAVETKARQRLLGLQQKWPDFTAPFMLNYRPEEEWQMLMPEDDETPCVLLDDNGRCLLYDFRPMTCRLHGLPLVDVSGEIMHDEWCSHNFAGIDPLRLEGLRGEFDRILREEVECDRLFTKELLGRVVYECDTLIPTALLIDFTNIHLKNPVESAPP